MTNVPLRYRLPNPPASFVGRQEEVASVTASLKDTHVTVLVGPGGVGKTALALHTLHKRFPKRVPHCLYLSLPSHQDELELRREIVRALVAASRTEIDWCLVQEHPDALVEVLLDLAEAGPYWLVLDDVDVQEGHADSLLEVLSLYARSSRYLVLARIAPRADLASGRVLEVGGLDEDAALALGRQLGKGLSAAELSEAVRASGGSPWLLRQALTAPPASGSRRASSQAALLEGLSDGARRFALLMSRLELPVPHATLSAASGVPEAVWRGELTARGWLQEGPGGVRLHEVARQGILAGAERVEAEAWVSAALELAQSPLSGVRLEGIRLLLEAEAFAEAEGPLDEALGQLLAEGYAPQLWKLLERVPSEWLSGVRLRCAAELGNPTVLRQLTQPLGGSAADRLTWAETLYMRGDLAGAVETLANLRRESSPEETIACAFEAHLLEARLAIAQGRPEEAHRLLGELSPASDEESVRRDALLQSCAPVDPDGDADPAALSLLQTLEQRSVDLPDRARAQVRFEVALAYLRRDALDAASSVLETPPPGDSGDTLALFETRRAIWLQAAVDLARGRLDAAEERLDQLEPFLSSPSLLRAEVYGTRARLWLAQGRTERALPLLQSAIAEAEGLGILATAHRCRELAARVEELLLVHDGCARRKRRSEDFLANLEASARDVERALLRAAGAGHRLRAAELRAEYCDALLLLDRAADLERETAELRRTALEMGARRWQGEADLLQMARELDWARLELLAAEEDVSPIAARRARALLETGPDELFDPLDRAVVDRLRGSSVALLAVPPSPESALTSPGWIPGWGLDVRRKSVWLPTGEWVDLTRRGLLARLLTSLARHGGSATKEQLVEEVWEESEYHPLRHDTRLQVTVHKLRELLEQDAGAPRLLLTTPSGYALASPFRVVPEAGSSFHTVLEAGGRLHDGVEAPRASAVLRQALKR